MLLVVISQYGLNIATGYNKAPFVVTAEGFLIGYKFGCKVGFIGYER